jgi:hypothetical protein
MSKQPIFSDPNTSYKVLVDGTVLAWKTPPSSGATASSDVDERLVL